MRFKFSTAWVAAVFPALVSAAWQGVLSEPGRQVEIDRESIVVDAAGGATAVGRVVLDRPIVDPKTSASYRIIEVINRYSCSERSIETVPTRIGWPRTWHSAIWAHRARFFSASVR